MALEGEDLKLHDVNGRLRIKGFLCSDSLYRWWPKWTQINEKSCVQRRGGAKEEMQVKPQSRSIHESKNEESSMKVNAVKEEEPWMGGEYRERSKPGSNCLMDNGSHWFMHDERAPGSLHQSDARSDR